MRESEAAAFQHRQASPLEAKLRPISSFTRIPTQTAAIPLLVADSPRSRIANNAGKAMDMDMESNPLPIARPSHISVPR